jgi:hypothetical protein
MSHVSLFPYFGNYIRIVVDGYRREIRCQISKVVEIEFENTNLFQPLDLETLKVRYLYVRTIGTSGYITTYKADLYRLHLFRTSQFTTANKID